jgi:ferric-dicitrate binding protein FerR (iron transport regulator)
MNAKRPDDSRPADEHALLLVGKAPEAAPSPTSRERARAGFLTGDPTGDLPVPSPLPVRRPSRSRWIPAALATAASLAVVIWFGSRPAEPWRLVGEHEMRLGDTLVLRVAPGSDVLLPDPPGRWFGRTRELYVSTGSVFASTGGEPLGFNLVVTTDDARTRITGTTFAVRRNGRGTCVCLYEGSVEVEQRVRGESVLVPTGRRVQVYSDGEAPAIEPLDDAEVAELEGLYDAI